MPQKVYNYRKGKFIITSNGMDTGRESIPEEGDVIALLSYEVKPCIEKLKPHGVTVRLDPENHIVFYDVVKL